MKEQYEIIYKSPNYKYWGQLDTYDTYSDAQEAFSGINDQNSPGIYQIIKVSYEVVQEKEVT